MVKNPFCWGFNTILKFIIMENVIRQVGIYSLYGIMRKKKLTGYFVSNVVETVAIGYSEMDILYYMNDEEFLIRCKELLNL